MSEKSERERFYSTVTLPLQTEAWQEHIILKRFDICRQIYNDMLRFELKQLRKMQRDPVYMAAMKTINEVYRTESGAARAEKKREKVYQEAQRIQTEKLGEYGFSEFKFTTTIRHFYLHFNQNISSTVAIESIAKPMWKGFHKLLFGDGIQVHYKEKGSWNSVMTDGISGIRVMNEKGKTVFSREEDCDIFCWFGTRGNRILKMPIILRDDDDYAREMLRYPFHFVRIIKRHFRSADRYFVQIVVEGRPVKKRNSQTGEILHKVNQGRVGIYVNTYGLTVCSKNGMESHAFSDGVRMYSDEKSQLLSYMARSRIAMNPGRYDRKGKLLHKDGKLICSKGYLRAKQQFEDYCRREDESRKVRRNQLVNRILSYGNEVVINDYPFQVSMAKQTGISKSEEWSRKKARQHILENAPAAFVETLDRKLKAEGFSGVHKVRLTDFDWTIENYREHYAALLYEKDLQ